MIEQKLGPQDGADRASSQGLIATIKVKALLEFSQSNPEFQQELSLNATQAAKTRGVELDETELDLLIRAFGQMKA
ncbi:MAG: hypothetical protein P8Q48_23570 [Paracoccaceae bacterium]|nr:hypothetical protein [Paracoccaceae bacterium]MDG1373170.1 hypothetical protein [Paracoccaceae bacterium]